LLLLCTDVAPVHVEDGCRFQARAGSRSERRNELNNGNPVL